jgi:hypothetical protein
MSDNVRTATASAHSKTNMSSRPRDKTICMAMDAATAVLAA